MHLINPFWASAAAGVTWNPADKSSDTTLSNGNLTASASGLSNSQVRANVSQSTGKYYYEVVLVAGPSASFPFLGIRPAGNALGGNGPADPGGDAGCFAQSPNSGHEDYHAGANLGAIGPAIAASDVFMVAADLTAHVIWVGRNGTWDTLFGTLGNPSTGVGGATIASGSWSPWCSVQGVTVTARFTRSAMGFTVPTAFLGWDGT